MSQFNHYKPDKFEKAMIMVIIVFFTVTLGGAILTLTIVRFSTPDLALFSIPNVIRGAGMLLFLIMAGLLLSNKGTLRNNKIAETKKPS